MAVMRLPLTQLQGRFWRGFQLAYRLSPLIFRQTECGHTWRPLDPPRWWPSIAGPGKSWDARALDGIHGSARDARRKQIIVPNREDSTVQFFDAATLAPLATVGVAAHPEQVTVMPDSSVAFVSATGANEVSAVDLKRHVLVANLQLTGAPAGMLIKPDGGELYVNVPTSHGLEIVDTWRTEISESMVLGSAPTDGI